MKNHAGSVVPRTFLGWVLLLAGTSYAGIGGQEPQAGTYDLWRMDPKPEQSVGSGTFADGSMKLNPNSGPNTNWSSVDDLGAPDDGMYKPDGGGAVRLCIQNPAGGGGGYDYEYKIQIGGTGPWIPISSGVLID